MATYHLISSNLAQKFTNIFVPEFKPSRLNLRVQFLFEKRAEPYTGYGEASIAEENCASVLRGVRSSKLCLEAGRPVREV